MNRRIILALACVALSGVAAMFLGGCAGATVSPTMVAGSLPRPDMIVVNDFAVTAAEVKLDRGLMATAARDAGDRSPSDEEKQVGHMVAETLSQALVEELRKSGISAARAGESVRISSTTAVLNGEFVTIDQGNQSGRVWVGFGMGGSELRTRIQVVQAGKLVAQADTATKSSLKPGMLTSLGGSAAAVAAGAAGSGVSETFMATVKADATRTAKEVAKKITRAYKDRGWLP